MSAVALDPGGPGVVWVCNRDNDSISRVDVHAGVTTDEIDVGVRPRSLAFGGASYGKLFVANQRGNVPHNVHMITPFSGGEVRGSVTVIDRASRSVVDTLTSVGVEPYGVAVAPSNRWFAVTGFRSATIKFFDVDTHQEILEHAFAANMNHISAGLSVADVDTDQDGMADLGEPRGFVIRSDSARLYVTHHRSPFVSALDLTLGPSGLPVAVAETRISFDDYPFDPFFAPTPVQTVASQGLPRFAEDVALSPDGAHVLIPHLLHNINHDVGFAFPADLPGAFANRVYPALTLVDALTGSFGQVGDDSNRLHHELDDPLVVAEFVSIGTPSKTSSGLAMIGGVGAPVAGQPILITVEGLPPGQSGVVHLGRPANVSAGSAGTRLVQPGLTRPVPPGGGTVSFNLRRPPTFGQLKTGSNGPAVVVRAQAVFFDPSGQPSAYSNGLDVVVGASGYAPNSMGRRAGHPSRATYNQAGDRALLLNRGSEDLFLFEVTGSGRDLVLRSTFPPRRNFVERSPLDTSTPLGDLPLGLVVADDPTTVNDDGLVFVVNELTRTLSVLRVGWATNTISTEHDQIPLLLGADQFGLSVRLGNELFEDASRAQTTGAPGSVGGFNNSCASCHLEGGEDGNVWQRITGPRSTMPVYQGTLLTGLMLWKGVRLNMGETGPMFAGENGGTGALTPGEQQALIDFHETIPVPLNPNVDALTGQITPLASLGRDLFLGINDTGLNPGLRNARCRACHTPEIGLPPAPRAFTTDFLDPALSLVADTLGQFDPFCTVLEINNIDFNVRNVNSGVNVLDPNGVPLLDRNGDGYVDLETYTPMNIDRHEAFARDDPNSYACPSDPTNPSSPPNLFQRHHGKFSIPTKLGVLTSGPYFHDHSTWSLRTLLDPEQQVSSPVYGSPAYQARGLPDLPGTLKMFNGFHDIRGHPEFVVGASHVQKELLSTNVDEDIEALLAFIESL